MTRHKFSKELFTRRPGGEMPVIVAAQNENIQSRFVVQKVLELREQGVPLSDIAILFRSGYLSFDLELELTRANVPFAKYGGLKLMETAHIKDLVSYLRVIANPRDAVAWNRILLLVDGVGPRTAERVLEDILAGRVKAEQAGSSTTLPAFWSNFHTFPDRLGTLFQALKDAAHEHLMPADRVQRLLQYYEPVFTTRYDDYHKRRKDLEMFQQVTERYRSLSTLLTDLALEPTTDSVTDIVDPGADDEKLVLSTIHSAKGLEWHSVFVLYALDGRFPVTRAAASDDTMEEERRLMYVACTRAKENLFITYPINVYDRETGMILSKPSRFVDGMPEKLLDQWVIDEE
jgi:DNA helicase-2/ATP-dependent DNA helicase PcrA